MEDGLMNPNITREDSFETEFLTGRTWATNSQLKPGVYAERMGAFGGEIPLAQIDVIPIPQIANTETTGAMITIPAAGRNPEEAFDLIRLLYTDSALLNLIIFGEEDIDFEYVDQGTGIVRLIPSGWDFANMGWTLGDQFLNYITEDESPTKWDDFRAFNEAGVPLPSLGFVADRTDPDLQTWLANVSATEERFWDLMNGLVPVAQVDATFDRYYSELVAAGVNEVIEELQRQFDAWLATR
jgi:putative aldouronate transport system substrate-binding protein